MTDHPRWDRSKPFEPGNTIAVTHGAHSPGKVSPLAEAIRERTLASAPYLRLPRFHDALWSYCWCEAQCALIRDWLDRQGVSNSRGTLRYGPISLLAMLERRAEKGRAELGLSPASAAAIMASIVATLSQAERDADRTWNVLGGIVAEAERR